MNIIRSAKSGNEWTTNELAAYNVTICNTEPNDFFNCPLASIDQYNQLLLSTVPPMQMGELPADICEFLTYVMVAAFPDLNQESAIDDLARTTLRITGFFKPGLTILRTRLVIPLLICSDAQRFARCDVSVSHVSSLILLLVQGDKTLRNTSDPEAQMIAEAIAAFQFNNNVRRQLDLPQLEEMVFPCITTVGTQPRFYVAPIKRELSDAVAQGRWTNEETIVTSCTPPKLQPPFHMVGLENVDYRRVALQYYITFRQLAETLWPALINGLNQ